MVKRSRQSRRRATGRGRPGRLKRWGARLLGLLVTVALVAVGLLALYAKSLEPELRQHFEGGRWAVPARVYARPLELYAGKALSPVELQVELEELGYRQTTSGRQPGSWSRNGAVFHLSTRGFAHPDGEEPARSLRLAFDGGQLASVTGLDDRERVGLARLEPAVVGSLHAPHQEDRLLVRLEQVPETLVRALLVVEDRKFFDHHGLSLTGIARAALANLRAGRVVQGGSTLTQQLVKNFYLSADQTLRRKFTEAVMALLLEHYYEKDEILEAYFNEVFLGQRGGRGVHGFGLGAEFYFGRPLDELSLAQQATLVGMVRGPSHYNPRRHPERARERRNLVLTLMARHGIIPGDEAREAMAEDLGVVADGQRHQGRYPAFMDLVRRHLQRDYRREDLISEGLHVHTTLAPRVQRAAERAVDSRLAAFGAEGLQAALVSVSVEDGEVKAVVGGADYRYAGFNRALDARRPIGSLVKPAVYLAALREPGQYALGTVLSDEPVTLRDREGEPWTPRNYDGDHRGEVPLWEALSDSLNVPTVRLSQGLGLRRVARTWADLGGRVPNTLYPSFVLGASEHSVLEMAQVYQTIAAEGFRTPLRAVRAVTDSDGELLSRYPLATEQAVDPASSYLLQHALEQVVARGTARGLRSWLGDTHGLAGKTGTTDDYRDAWYAGYSGDLLSVVWLGRDDNQPIGLTGSGGAMPVWGEQFQALSFRRLNRLPPAGVEEAWIDYRTGRRSGPDCDGAVALPYISGHLPAESVVCAREPDDDDRRGFWDRVFRR